jgi:hypothetical protein
MNPKIKFHVILGVLNTINDDIKVIIGTIPAIIPTLVDDVYINARFCKKKYKVIPDIPAPKKYNSSFIFLGLCIFGYIKNKHIIDIKKRYISIVVGENDSNRNFVTTNVDDQITTVINASVCGSAFFII